MTGRESAVYEFGPFRLDEANQLLLCAGRRDPVPLKPKAFETLLLLASHPGRLLTRQELIERLWPQTFVEEANLTQNIYELRRVLGELAPGQRFVDTVPKRGYRFVAGVSRTTVSEAWEGGQAPAARTLAVLPFRPLPSRDRDEYLELGIADALIAALSTIRTLTVRPTSAVQRFAGAAAEPSAAGRTLRVETVLEGTIQRQADRLRVTARLVRVADEATLWAGKYDEAFTDVFAVQDAIAEKVLAALAVTLTRDESRRLLHRHTASTEVHHLYLKARHYWHKWTPDSWKRSIQCAAEATSKDPAHAPSYAVMAASYCTLGIFGVMPPADAFAKARALVDRALQIDETVSEAWEVRGAIALFHDWDWPAVARVLRRAIVLNRSNAGARDLYALYLTAIGRAEDGIVEVRRALDVDPLSLLINTDVGNVLYYARAYAEAAAQLRATLELDPFFAHAHYACAYVHLQTGRFVEGIASMQRAVDLSGRDRAVSPDLGYAYGVSGRPSEAREVLARLLRPATGAYIDPYGVALVYLGLGDADEAFTWLSRAFEQRSRPLMYARVDPVYDRIRDDARFTGLLRRMQLA